MPSMMPGMPSVYPPFGAQPVYPAGQGPLADVSATRGENGLYRAPEPEGPEPHEAKPFLRLNPAEAAKYIEYWDEACEGEDKVSGPHAVAFLGRAPKVSKAQLRKVWQVADHRNEGFLDQEQFYIALRLVALAQRGAELSVAGLRNFTGIQLIPNISPPPPPPPPEPEPSSEPLANLTAVTSTAPAATENTSSVSWFITLQIAQKFDEYFNGLATNGGPLLDAAAAVPFFVKSGLPRPVLRTIWQLADVSKDGKLSREEFRTAMHLVTCLRNRRITVEDLPDHLDPNGPNWVRIEGESVPVQPPVDNVAQSPSMAVPPHEPDGTAQPFFSASSLGLPHPGSSQPMTEQAAHAMASMEQTQPSQGYDTQNIPRQVPDEEEQWRREARAERDERRRMLDELRLEREEMERTRREMEAMRTEMLRMRMGNSSTPSGESLETKSKLPAPSVLSDELLAPSKVTPIQSEPLQNSEDTLDTLLGTIGYESASQGKPETKSSHSVSGTTQSALQKATVAGGGVAVVKEQEQNGGNRTVNSGGRKVDDNDDDDDDDEEEEEDDDEDEDDDGDFWGGLGPKPTLGATATQNSSSTGADGAASGTTKTFGGSELDDWVF